MNIPVKYFADIDKLEYVEGKSDWIDLRAAEDIVLKKDEFKLIPLGIAMQLPAGYEAHIVPRSSTFKNYGIIQTNHMGIVDEKYCGDNDQWFLPVYCLQPRHSDKAGNPVTIIYKNERICQFRIEKHQPKLTFDEVTELGNEDRGGHGSTGKN